jgi:hypothetical protein
LTDVFSFHNSAFTYLLKKPRGTGYRINRGNAEALIPSRVQHEINGLLSPTLSSKGGEGENAESVLRLVSSGKRSGISRCNELRFPEDREASRRFGTFSRFNPSTL